MNKQLFAIILSFATGVIPVLGQANLAQTEPSKIYDQGVELFEKKKFNLAYRYFDQYISKAEEEEFAKPTLELAKAQYYKAVSAKGSNSLIAEKLLLDFIEDYAGTAGVYPAFYHLGDLYFKKSNYKDAIKYYALTESQSLTKEEKDDWAFNYAFSYFSLKNFRESYNRFAPLTNQPNSKNYNEAVYYSGLSAYYLEKYDDALKQFYKLENSSKYKNIVPYYIASILSLKKQYPEMIAYLEPKIENNRSLRYSNEIKKLLLFSILGSK